MKSSQIIAVIIAVASIAWVGSGFLTSNPSVVDEQEQKISSEETKEALIEVRVRDLVSENFVKKVVLTGRSQASKTVTIRAETNGRVDTLLKSEGEKIVAQDVLARLDLQDRAANVKEAKERVSQREIEFNAAQKLQDKGFNSRVRLAQASADLENARAALTAMEVELSRILILSPFDGIIDSQNIEVGDYVSNGDSLFTLVDLDPIEISGFVSERQVDQITLGSKVQAELLNGEMVEGTLSFIAPAANIETRTFRVEITVPNSDYAIKDGLTTKLHIPVAPKKAHKISPSILALNDNGRLGVKIVNVKDQVEFKPVIILSDTPEHMWVSGLPDKARVITVGQEFVIKGQHVKPVQSNGDGLL